MKSLFEKEILVILCGIVFTLFSCENELTILGEDSSNLNALKTQKETFEKNSDVKLSFRPNSLENATEKALQDFINNTGIYDVILQYNFSLSTYVKESYVWPLDSLLKKYRKRSTGFESDIFKSAWNEVGYYYKNPENPDTNNLQKIGYPFATNTLLLVYNKKLFEKEDNKKAFYNKYRRELNIPKDWELFRMIAEFFTKDKTKGICMQGSKGSWLYYEYCTILYSMNGAIFNKKYGWEGDLDTEIAITSPESVAATKYYLSLKDFNKGDYYNVDATEQIKLIKEGNVAMGLVWSDYLYGLIKGDASSQFGFAAIPGKKSPIAGGCYYVNKDTKHPDAALDFILYMMQPDTQVKLALKGLCSPLRSTYKNKEVLKAIPYSQALEESLDRATYMFEAGLESQFVSDYVTEHIQKLWKNNPNVNVEQELNQLAIKIDDIRRKVYKK